VVVVVGSSAHATAILAPVVVESKQKVGRFDKVNRRFPNWARALALSTGLVSKHGVHYFRAVCTVSV
jgi:hypothetical protein